MATDEQREKAMAIADANENSRLKDYSGTTMMKGDSGGLSYGRNQVTRASGGLYEVVAAYVNARGRYAAQLSPYLSRLKSRDPALDEDQPLRDWLRKAGGDRVMQTVQDEIFIRRYWVPTSRDAQRLGITSDLGVAIVYDSHVQGRWTTTKKAGEGMSERTTRLYGSPAQIGEQAWLRRYVEVRTRYLRDPKRDRKSPLYISAYRMDEFQKLVDAGNWDLTLPITVHGVRITAERLGVGAPPSRPAPAPTGSPPATAPDMRPTDPAQQRIYDAVKWYVLHTGVLNLLDGTTAAPDAAPAVSRLRDSFDASGEELGAWLRKELRRAAAKIQDYLEDAGPAAKGQLPAWIRHWGMILKVGNVTTGEILAGPPETRPARPADEPVPPEIPPMRPAHDPLRLDLPPLATAERANSPDSGPPPLVPESQPRTPAAPRPLRPREPLGPPAPLRRGALVAPPVRPDLGPSSPAGLREALIGAGYLRPSGPTAPPFAHSGSPFTPSPLKRPVHDWSAVDARIHSLIDDRLTAYDQQLWESLADTI